MEVKNNAAKETVHEHDIFIKCIDNGYVEDVLTKGKIYIAIRENTDSYVIVDDKGHVCTVNKICFSEVVTKNDYSAVAAENPIVQSPSQPVKPDTQTPEQVETDRELGERVMQDIRNMF